MSHIYRVFIHRRDAETRRGEWFSPRLPPRLRASAVSFGFLFFALSLSAAPADWIWSARYVITEDAQHRVIENGAVAIVGDHIVGVGTRAEIDARFQARQRLDRPEAILAPGLINTHTHAAMSLFRGIADDRKLQDWLEKFIFPAEARNVTADFVRWGTRLGCLEMLLGGTTTFTDMYYFEDVVAEAAKEAGMRGVLGETIIGFPVADAKTPADALKFTEGFLTRFRHDPLVVPAVAPHALYTNSDETLKASRALANKYDAPLVIHLSETKKENDDILAQRHMSPTRVLDSLGVLTGRTVAAHCVWVDDADMAILKARGTGVAHCPSSNMKLASGVAPVVKMLAMDIKVGLGPDGPAGSNNDFNMFEEMDLAAKLQKVTAMDPQVLPAGQALEMATIRGARALGMEKEIGSLEAGKRADLILVRIDRPNAVPLYDAVSQMVYALKADDVRDVMVNGKPVVRDAKILTLDEKAILAKAAEYRIKVSKSLE
ncbi:5-methylthioadenosine/S-adenosylhomocysteine deaminase 1 [Candidatus Sulfopaludibacter sp. SbA3]|nr:5-methylthioadenosine/S-adenosylhomocysteine deaminase 1 [Candidatus Sulfopaludibacter sp. SbA3]